MQDFNRAHFNSFARDFYAQQRKAEQWQRHKSQYHNANYEDFSRNYDALKNNQSMRANTQYGLLNEFANSFAYDNSFTSGVTDTAATWLAGGARLLGQIGFDTKDFANRADEVKRQVRINHDINRGDSTFSNIVYGAGTIAPELILPAGQIKLGTGLLGNIARGAGYGALGGGLTSALDSDQSWGQAAWGAGMGATAGGLLGGAGASLLGKFTGHGFSNSPKAGLLNSTIDDAGNIKVDPIVGATNASDDAIARAMNAQHANEVHTQTQSIKPNFVMVGEPKTINPIDAELELVETIAQQAKLDSNIIRTSLEILRAKHPEMFKSRGDVFRLLREIKNNPDFVGDSLKDPSVAYLAKIMKNDESMVGSPTVPTQPSSSRGVGANARSLIPYNPTTQNLNNGLENMENAVPLGRAIGEMNVYLRDMQGNTQMSLKPNAPFDMKTMHKLKAAAINAPTATQQQYEAYYKAMWSGDKEQISKTLPFIKIAHFNETFSKLFGIEKQAVFFTKQSISHARESRKISYNQDLPEVFVKDIPNIINNAQGGFYDKVHKNFFIVQPLRNYGIESNQLGFIHFNKDILGNYIVTMKRADADSLHNSNYVEVGRGIAPHIPTEQDSIASPFLNASPTSSVHNPTTQNLNNSLQSNTFARNLAHQAATNGIAGTAGGIANVALDDSDDSLALKFAKGFALGVATKVAAKHGMNAGAKASKQAFEFAMHKSAQFSTLLRENPQLFTRFLNKQLTDDFAQFGGARSGLHAECFAVAEALSKKGVSAEEILSRTGWFKGLDGEWKIQLDLRGGAAYKLKDGTYNLSQLFKQDSLYAAYPFLRKVRVEIAKLPENVQGSFEPTTGIITLNSANNKLDFTKALAHELQHVIQKYEGFAQGSSTKNPNYWTSAGEVEARATFKNGEDNPIRRLENEKAEGALIETTSKGTSDLEIPNSATLRHSQKLNIEMAQKDMILLKELAQQPLDIQKEMIRKWNVQEMRVNIEKSFNVQPLKEFGTNYAEYMRDGEGAINKLLNEKQGQVSGAFYREDLQKLSGNGNIDLVWGDSRFGLAHILDKHPNIISNLSDVLQNGELKIRQNEAIQITKDNYKVILKSNWKGEPTKNKWIVTAYEDEKGLSISSKPLTEADSLASNSNGIISQTNDNLQHSLQSPLDSLKSAQGRINGLVAFAKYLANPPAHLRGDAQRLRADVSAMRELDMHTRQALTDKANAIDALAYQTGYPEPQYSMKNPRQKQKFAEDSVGILQQIRAKSREGMEKIMRNSWVNGALGTRIYGENFADYRFMKDVFDKDIAANSSQALALHNKLKLLSEDAQRKMHHYMVGDTKGEDLSSELKALADSFRKEVRKETDELVKLGLLDKAVAEKWGDVYLLREYSTRIGDKLKRAIKGLASEDYGIGLDTIHMRGKKQKVSAKTYQEMLQKGEIGDITKGKWEVLHEPSKHEPHYILRRDYTRSEREKMGEIDLISYSLPRTQ